MKFNIGDEIRIIDAGFGATGCNGSIGIITNRDATNGLADDMKGFNVEIVQGNYRATKGEAWRVDIDGEYELIKRGIKGTVADKKGKPEIFIYERQPLAYNTHVKDLKGHVTCIIHSIFKEKSEYKVICNGLTTIVILKDGSKGIAKCNPTDKYSRQIGHDIAFKRATIKSFEKELNQLCGKGV